MYRRKLDWIKSLLLVTLLGWSTLTYAPPFGRAYHSSPRPEPSRVYEPREERVHTEDAFRRPFDPSRNSTRAEETRAPEKNWKTITDALGGATREVQKAYVSIILLSGGVATITTNFLKEGAIDAPIVPIAQEKLLDESALNKVISDLIGTSSDPLTLKLIINDKPDSESFKVVFDRNLQTFSFNTDRFQFADLYVRGGDRVISLERISRESGSYDKNDGSGRAV